MRFFEEDIPVAVLKEFNPEDVEHFTAALKFCIPPETLTKTALPYPPISPFSLNILDFQAANLSRPAPNLALLLQSDIISPEAEEYVTDASQELEELSLADFEMSRLKEIKEASLLRGYFKLEKDVPEAWKFIVTRGFKIMVIWVLRNY